MKKILLSTLALLFSAYCMAQEELSFPFQGGKNIMNRFFKENLIVTPEIIKKRATGLVLFKFTADENGKLTKMIIYYADDKILAGPVVEAMKKSNRKWVIPNHEQLHDYIIPFSFNINTPVPDSLHIEKSLYNGYLNRAPITTTNQVPLDMATLLPAVMVNYDITP